MFMPTASPHIAPPSSSVLPHAPADSALNPVLENARIRVRAASLGYAGNLSPAEAFALHRAGEALLVDVRTAEELQAVGRVQGAQHMPWLIGERMERNPDFLAGLNRLASRDEPVLLLCRSGKRSVAAARAATEAGFSLVFNILEGFEGDSNLGYPNGWQHRGLPWDRD